MPEFFGSSFCPLPSPSGVNAKKPTHPLSANQPPFVTVRAVLRPMHPAAKTLLVSASDNASYVMRAPDANGQCRILFREALGSLLGAHLGLPMADWSVLALERAILGAADPRTVAHEAGKSWFCFGSRIPDAHGPLYEYLPVSMIRGTEVARQITRMQVFDNWVANLLPRKYVAFRSQNSEALEIRFLGNASILFPLPNSDFDQALGPNPYLKAKRLGIETPVVDKMMDDIAGVMRNTLKRLVSLVPDGWVSVLQAELALDVLSERQHRVIAMRSAWREDASHHQAVEAASCGQVASRARAASA